MLIEAEIWSIARIGQDNAVLVRPVGGELAVPIYIDQYQTQSILIGLGNVPMPRPLTHDLLISILNDLKVKIDRVEITGLKDGTYYAQIIIDRGQDKLTIDARPSDSIAIAVRLKCPIFIAEAVVEEAGSKISSITGETEGAESESAEEVEAEEVGEGEGRRAKSKKELLQEQLQKAIEEENYEEAAVLRDKIANLDTGDS